MSQTQISPSILSPGGPTWGPFGTLSAVAVTTGNLSASTTTPNTNLTVVGNISATGTIYGGVPAGAVMSFATATAPAGWVACDGSFLNNLNPLYANLFNAIGYTFGGSGTNFKLPDLRGMFVRGTGTNATIQNTGGQYVSAGNIGTTQIDTFGSHYHTGIPVGVSKTLAGGSTNYDINVDRSGATSSVGAQETRPVNISLLYCIKL